MTPTPDPAKVRRKRLSLTRADIETTAGLELLQVLQSIADDGQLTEEEVKGLRSWLATNAATNLPSHEYLTTVINEVLRDDIITDDEFKLLHDAVLRVLPPELRSIADLRRREQRKRSSEERKQQRNEEALRGREERDRNRPLERADFMIAGATIGEDRREACEGCCEDDVVSLVREPDNPYDSNAILVICEDGSDLGYVPRTLAKDLAPLLDGGARQEFKVKKLLGTSSDRIIPVIVGCLYGRDTDRGSPTPPATEFRNEPSVALPPRASNPSNTRSVRPVVAAGTRTKPLDLREHSDSPWTFGDIGIWIVCAAAIALLGAILYVVYLQ